MLNILIINDEAAVRNNFLKILKPRGFNVVTAVSGHEGIQLVEKQEFDLVFVCSHLNDIDGIKIMELINRKKRDQPVVLCCGMDELSVAVQAVKSGAYDFIEEPFKNSDILRISKEILIVGRAVGAVGDDEGGLTTTTGTPAALRVIRRSRRRVPHVDGVEGGDIDAKLHGW